MAPVYRFADAAWRATAETNMAAAPSAASGEFHTGGYPVVSLDDEIRYTLSGRVRADLLFAPALKIGSDASLQLRLPVPPTLQLGDRVALEAESMLDKLRRHHPISVAKVEMRDGAPGMALELFFPADYANRTIGLFVRGTVLPRDTATHHRTVPVTVPQSAYLDFAIGIEEAARGQGPVEFQVQSCVGHECATIFSEVVDPSISDEQDWQQRRVELAALADREVSFSFESRLIASKPDAFSLAVWANPTVYAPTATSDARPNIILISLDTLSANHLPTYGYEFPTAPFLDGVLAREGLVFERAVAAATTTPQSHMSMFTSVQPCRHGVVTGMEAVRAGLVTLAEALRAASYETGAVTEDGWLGYQHGFARGFNFYAENKSSDLMLPEGQFELTLAKARGWIRRNRDKPFFLFLHTFQVHDPYSPPDQYKDLFRDRDGVATGDASLRPRRDRVAYDQEIRYTDDLLKAFFAFLRERRLLDNTVIIVTADHGEEFFEHGFWGHGRTLYDEVTRVPLIFWGPSRVPAGERNAQTVGHIDLMPTILELAGVPVPAQATGRNILAPVSPSRPATPDFRFTESRVMVAASKDYELIEVIAPSFMVQEGSRKMSRYRERDGFRYEAYNVAVDPHEKSNRLPADGAAFEPMKRLLDGYEAACAAELGDENGQDSSRRIELDPRREEKLRALGYLQ